MHVFGLQTLLNEVRVRAAEVSKTLLAGDTTENNLDASWIYKFTNDGVTFELFKHSSRRASKHEVLCALKCLCNGVNTSFGMHDERKYSCVFVRD